MYQKFLKKFITIDIPKVAPKQLSNSFEKIFFPFEGINDGCFKKFFPGLSIAKDVEAENAVANTSIFNPPTPSSGSATGCTVMKLGKDASNDKKFVFESQTLIKNEKTGIFVQGSSKNVKLTDDSNDESKLILQYTVLFLENVDNSGWSVRWGASLNEEADDHANSLHQVNIKSPDGSINETFETVGTDSSIPKDWNYEYYLGIWKEDNSGKSVLEDVVVADNKSTASILGNKSGSFGGIIGSGTYLSTNYVYNKNTQKWIPQTENFGKYLTDWFKPFKDKKGKWIELQSYCKSPDSNLKDFCK